jgi:hypothetical protein
MHLQLPQLLLNLKATAKLFVLEFLDLLHVLMIRFVLFDWFFYNFFLWKELCSNWLHLHSQINIFKQENVDHVD